MNQQTRIRLCLSGYGFFLQQQHKMPKIHTLTKSPAVIQWLSLFFEDTPITVSPGLVRI